MVKFSFWDKFFGSKKKRINFIKNAQNQIRKNTLYYLQDFGRAKWVKTEEIFNQTLIKTDLFNSEDGKTWFLCQGAKGQISNATHKLRNDGYPVISGRGGKGYRYADENSPDFIHLWDEALSSCEERQTRADKEKERYRKLINKIIERLKSEGREEEAKQMQKVLVKYES